MTDPLIEQARAVNEAAWRERELADFAAQLDARLGERRALRAKRSDAAKRGWSARRG